MVVKSRIVTMSKMYAIVGSYISMVADGSAKIVEVTIGIALIDA